MALKTTKLTDDQSEMVLAILSTAKKRKRGYDPSSRTIQLQKEETKVIKKLGTVLHFPDDTIMRLVASQGTVKILQLGKEAEESSPPKKKTVETKTTKTPPKKKTTSKKENTPAPEKRLSDTHPHKLEPCNDFLIWVGYHPYPRIINYTQEALEHGFLKKARYIPEEFKEGSTKIFLAHNEGFDGLGVIIGYCPNPKLQKGKIAEYPKRRDNSDMGDVNAVYLTGDFKPFTNLINIKGENKTKAIQLIDGKAVMKSKAVTSSPYSRAETKLKTKMKKTKSRWTEAERQQLVDFIKSDPDDPNRFRKFAAASGRTSRSVEYQWYGPIKKLGIR